MEGQPFPLTEKDTQRRSALIDLAIIRCGR